MSNKLYHYSLHEFAVGDTVEARISFPFPDAWAWAATGSLEALQEELPSEYHIYEVEPLGAVLQSPVHDWAVRSQDGFRVVAKV